MRATLALHGLALLLLLHPQSWPLSLGLVVANHLLLAAAGLWPRGRLLGGNATRLGARAAAAGQIAITIDDGPDPKVTPQVLELLDHHRCRATFFCIGQRVAAHVDLAREIVRRGHRIENHTQHHPLHFSVLGPARMREEIAKAQATICEVTGEPPRYFRAPAGLHNPFLDPVLHGLGLQLVSWTRRGFDTISNDPALVLARLTHNLKGGDILLLHDGHAARATDGRPVILNVLPELLQAIAAARLSTVRLNEGLE